MPSQNERPDLPLEIDVHAVKQLLDADQPCLLLDCREPFEHDHVHLPDARLIPMQQLPRRLDELGEDRWQRIIVYCHLGQRSYLVTEWLRDQGYAQVQSMAGGIDAWSVLIDPSVPRY